MKKFLLTLLTIFISSAFVGIMFAASSVPDDIGFTGSPYPEGTIVTPGEMSIIAVLSFIQ
jgi:hypothetical protein